MFAIGVLFVFGIGFALMILLPIPQIGFLWFLLGGIIWVKFDNFVKKNRADSSEDDGLPPRGDPVSMLVHARPDRYRQS